MSPQDFAQQAGLSFQDQSLLKRALTHRSYVNEHHDALEDNERLEFLGDAVLDFLTGALLYNHFPEMNEGQLTRLRSELVRTEQLAAFAQEIHLGEALLLGRGEETTGGRERPALLCAGYEALIGALYLDAGMDAVLAFTEDRLKDAAECFLQSESLLDARSKLQIWAQAEMGETPHYRTIDSYGPDHAREFVIEVSIARKLFAKGKGRSKQEAAKRAASALIRRIGLESDDMNETRCD